MANEVSKIYNDIAELLMLHVLKHIIQLTPLW